MIRQRIRLRGSSLAVVGRALLGLLAAAVVFYALVLLLLAVDVLSATTANDVSGYRTIFDFFAGLGPADVDGATRGIVAGAGILAFLVFGFLALRELPRPYAAHKTLELERADRGRTTIEPQAVERMAETAAEEQAGVAGSRGRAEEAHLVVDVSVRRAREVADVLRGVQDRVREAMEEHGLSPQGVDVRLTGFEPKTRRELN